VLKILLIYYEPQASGQTTHVLSLARGLDRQRYAVTVAVPERLERSIAAFRQSGVEVTPLPLNKALWPHQAVVGLVRLVRASRFDLVHVHSQEAGLVARPLAWLARAPAIVYTPQTVDIRRVRRRWLYALVEHLLARVTDAIVSVNTQDKQRLIGWGIPAHKIVTVANGVDLARFSSPPDASHLRQALGLAGNVPVVMQLGRLCHQKHPEAFVEGAALVAAECPAARFALVGDGPLRERVAAYLRELGLEGRVHVMGGPHEAFRLLVAADVVTLTSRWEGAPYAVLEAMAWSRPVVVTAVNGCSEIVVDGLTGYVVPSGDTARWARAVTDLIRNRDKARAMGAQGRQRVEKEFRQEQMIARLEALYDQVTTRKKDGDLQRR